jgi:hypothetical protein
LIKKNRRDKIGQNHGNPVGKKNKRWTKTIKDEKKHSTKTT